MQGLNDFVSVTPAAGGVVEDLVGEEVLIGGVERGAAGVVQAIGVDLDRGGICCISRQSIEGGIEVFLHFLPLPFALVVFEKVRVALVVVEEA